MAAQLGGYDRIPAEYERFVALVQLLAEERVGRHFRAERAAEDAAAATGRRIAEEMSRGIH